MTRDLKSRVWRGVHINIYHIVAAVLLFGWTISYITSGTGVEWGDFNFFAQAYEAIRISILHYHQFPWLNPWMSGGVPLYANPQIGVFSLQTIFVLLFGAPIGLKISLAVYTFFGYGAAYLLFRKYFGIEKLAATALSLIWLFCSFFVAHLPEHFTFVWYMLAPGYFYGALAFRNWRSGLVLGFAFAIMGLSQLHNPFFHVSLICCLIVIARLVLQPKLRKMIVAGSAAIVAIFLLFDWHRLFFTFQNVHDFPHIVLDPAPSVTAALKGLILPLSFVHPFQFIAYPAPPQLPWGFTEDAATIGVFALIALLISLLYLSYNAWILPRTAVSRFRSELVLLGLAAVCFLLALGRFAKFAPYNFLKHLPVFSMMRVSTRWFLFFDLTVLIFIGLLLKHMKKNEFAHFVITTLLCCGVAELFFLNAGYAGKILSRKIVVPVTDGQNYTFEQTSYFGQTLKLPNGEQLPNDGNMPHAYREYEATRWNLGILYANDSLVQLALDPRHRPGGHPTCPWEEGCNFVLSNNATVLFWSPNKIVLGRTGAGPVKLNMNNSNYFLINGKREKTNTVVAPFSDFVIPVKDAVRTITIEAKPSLQIVIQGLTHKQQPVKLN